MLGINIVQKPGIYKGSDNRLVSFAGRLILVKHTLSAISIHLFSVFRAPAYFCFKSEKYCYQFLWKKGTSKGVCWKLSETLSCASPWNWVRSDSTRISGTNNWNHSCSLFFGTRTVKQDQLLWLPIPRVLFLYPYSYESDTTVCSFSWSFGYSFYSPAMLSTFVVTDEAWQVDSLGLCLDLRFGEGKENEKLDDLIVPNHLIIYLFHFHFYFLFFFSLPNP